MAIIIAEAGVNHNGSLERARRMVEIAAEAGVDYVKFQTFKAEKLVTRSGRTAAYQEQACHAESQLEMLKELELSYGSFSIISEYCREYGVGFLSTPFDMESISFLSGLGMDFMKVPSGEVTNLPYLRGVAATRIPVIMSTGMCTLGEVEEALQVFLDNGYSREEVVLLHCTTEYPAPYSDVNLRAMLTLGEAFGTPFGYSDHTQGTEVTVASVALGASVVEKHFTLSRSLPGPDHAASLEPEELKRLVREVRNVSLALGDGIKTVSQSEKKNKEVARKSIVAAREIRRGEVFSPDNIGVKRPGGGLSPMLWDEIIGKVASRDFQTDEYIEI